MSRMQNDHINFFRCTESYMLSSSQIPCMTPISKLHHFSSIPVAKGRMVGWFGLKHPQRLQQDEWVYKSDNRLQVDGSALHVFHFRSPLRGVAHAGDNRLQLELLVYSPEIRVPIPNPQQHHILVCHWCHVWHLLRLRLNNFPAPSAVYQRGRYNSKYWKWDCHGQ